VYPDDIILIARNITVLNYVLLALEIKGKNWDEESVQRKLNT